MYAASSDYYRARTLSDVQGLWQQHPDAKLVAGGHSLIPMLKLRLSAPPALIDIGGIEALKGITASAGRIRIGALTTHTELSRSNVLKTGAPMLAEAAGGIGDAQVRNWGTIGGNIAHADPGSDLPAVVVALDAQFTVEGPAGTRTLPAASCFRGLMLTALGEREVLTAIEFATAKSGDGMAYAKFAHPASRYAVLGAAACVSLSNGTCTECRVAVGGAIPAATRMTRVETALVGKPATDDSIASAAAQVELGDDVLGDVFASADYRRAMAVVYVRRALAAAVARAAQ